MSITIKDLSFSYGSEFIINSINAEFHTGEVTVIAGPNGSGKSTLVKAIMTLIDIKKGHIFLNKKDILSLSHIDRAKKIGYVAQDMPRDFDFTVYEIVEMGRYPYKKEWDIKKDSYYINRALKLTDSIGFKDRSIKTLSGGELQRVLLARALAGNPKYLILDEPASNLDIKHNIDMMKLIKSLTTELKITTIMVLHDLNSILHYGDKVILLRDGRILKSGSVKNVFTPETIESTYSIKSSVVRDKYGNPHIVTT